MKLSLLLFCLAQIHVQAKQSPPGRVAAVYAGVKYSRDGGGVVSKPPPVEMNALLARAKAASGKFDKKYGVGTWDKVLDCQSKSYKDSTFQKCLYCCALKDVPKDDTYYHYVLDYALPYRLKKRVSFEYYGLYSTETALANEVQRGMKWEKPEDWTCEKSKKVTDKSFFPIARGVCPELYASE
uniref:Uncharacterized protein n=1 Tax=Chromera velia CCMP2878 TaxID=1169474 RepID=A0A0G4IF73_9ALVE|eukprot:Cvel_13811.t1-p1 / transcript=Cvel_13811.t1 / gene=Cvel_13811 / organism=Chromera_velia_CCMP2878 / gene_product=hypothetical protein / transcript_product=hypothetical protein / location=Cvel_scaffold958:41374-41919(-) / protein_length=182 / sequence_SO=supercontig / SO=protein_coding / is_pseudo=false